MAMVLHEKHVRRNDVGVEGPSDSNVHNLFSVRVGRGPCSLGYIDGYVGSYPG